jgi:hypothetical protein
MIFCQACGAQNTDDAKFCNMCGARIAQAGEPGGPLTAKAGPGGAPAGFATAPNAMNNTTSITLAGIGVQSPARTWAILIGGAALFLVVGAGGAWVALRSTGAPPSTAGQDEAGLPAPPDTAPVEIGDPVPTGQDTPDDGVVISSGPRVRPRGTSGSRGGSRGGEPGEASPGAQGAGAEGPGATGSRSPAGGEGAGPGTREGAAGASSGTGSGGSGASGAGAGSTGAGGTTTAASAGGASGDTTSGGRGASEGGGPAAGGEGTSAGNGSTRDWGAMQETVGEDEPDLVMEHYSVTVRRFIRNYYAQRAAGCFDHESRTTGQVVRGTVVVAFTIGPDGHAQNANVSRNTTGSAALGQCLQRNVAAWELPVPPNRQPIDMEMPFSR